MVTVAAPALGMLGVAPLVAHFFVFYYGVLADVTPPVAISAYAGASMAGADPFKTGNTAFRLALGKVLVPFVFVFSPSMLIMVPDFTRMQFVGSTLSCIVSVVLLSAAFAGWLLAPLAMWERLTLALAALPMILATPVSVLVGVVIAAPVMLRQVAARRLAMAWYWRGAPRGSEPEIDHNPSDLVRHRDCSVKAAVMPPALLRFSHCPRPRRRRRREELISLWASGPDSSRSRDRR